MHALHTHTHTHTHTHQHKHTHTHTHTRTRAHAHARTHAHTHTRTRTHARTHTHTHTQSVSFHHTISARNPQLTHNVNTFKLTAWSFNQVWRPRNLTMRSIPWVTQLLAITLKYRFLGGSHGPTRINAIIIVSRRSTLTAIWQAIWHGWSNPPTSTGLCAFFVLFCFSFHTNESL